MISLDLQYVCYRALHMIFSAESVRMVDRADGGGEIVSCTEPVEKGISAEVSLVPEICMGVHAPLLVNLNVILIANVLMILHAMESDF